MITKTRKDSYSTLLETFQWRPKFGLTNRQSHCHLLSHDAGMVNHKASWEVWASLCIHPPPSKKRPPRGRFPRAIHSVTELQDVPKEELSQTHSSLSDTDVRVAMKSLQRKGQMTANLKSAKKHFKDSESIKRLSGLMKLKPGQLLINLLSPSPRWLRMEAASFKKTTTSANSKGNDDICYRTLIILNFGNKKDSLITKSLKFTRKQLSKTDCILNFVSVFFIIHDAATIKLTGRKSASPSGVGVCGLTVKWLSQTCGVQAVTQRRVSPEIAASLRRRPHFFEVPTFKNAALCFYTFTLLCDFTLSWIL